MLEVPLMQQEKSERRRTNGPRQEMGIGNIIGCGGNAPVRMIVADTGPWARLSETAPGGSGYADTRVRPIRFVVGQFIRTVAREHAPPNEASQRLGCSTLPLHRVGDLPIWVAARLGKELTS